MINNRLSFSAGYYSAPVFYNPRIENWIVLVRCVLFNSRTAIAGAIIGLLLVFFYLVVMIFVTTI